MDLVDVRLVDSNNEISTDNPLLNQYRNLAKIEFVLCHSLPLYNTNNASWTYPTLVRSVNTVNGNVINLNHLMRDNSDVLNKEIKNDIIIGYMSEGKIVELEVDEKGNYPLVPAKPIPIIATGYLWKRTVSEIISRMKNGEKFKVSMECEYESLGFLYDNEFYTSSDKPEFIGVREFNGKPVVRVLGGISPEGGEVNFWGVALLDKVTPADQSAKVLTTVAMEIGDLQAIEGEVIMAEKFTDKLNSETANILQAILTKNLDDINEEFIANALIEQDKKVKELEQEIQNKINDELREQAVANKLPIAETNPSWDSSAAKKRVAQWASNDQSGDRDKIDWEKYGKAFFYTDINNKEDFSGYKLPFADVAEDTLKAIPRGVFAAAAAVSGARGGVTIPSESLGSVKSDIEFYYHNMERKTPWENASDLAAIKGSLEEHVQLIEQNFKEALMISGEFNDRCWIRGTFSDRLIVEQWDETAGCTTWEVMYSYDSKGNIVFGDKNQVKVNYVETVEPIKEDDVKNPQMMPSGILEYANEDNNDNNEGASEMEVKENNENENVELASLKTRVEELVLEVQNLKNERDNLVQEKEQATRSALIDSRKKALEADFDLEDLLDGDDEQKLGSMSEDDFTAFAAKMKKIVTKSKNYKQLWNDGASSPTPKEEENNNEVSLEQGGVDVTTKLVTPAVPEFQTSADLKSKFKF